MSPIDTSRRAAFKLVGIGTAIVVGGGTIVGAAQEDAPEEEEEEEEEEREEEDEEETEEAEVEFDDQDAHHSTVRVAEAKLPDGGFIVIHHFDHDAGGKIIGVSPPLRAGEYENMVVEVDTLSEGDHELSAMLHKDDPHNGELDFPGGGDPPYEDDDGNIVQAFAQVTF